MKTTISNYISNNILLCIILICAIYRIHFFGIHIHYIKFNSDSLSYFTPINLLKGEIDLYRTPIYPLLLQLFQSLSQKHFIENLFLFQHIISFLSIIPFYYTLKYLFKNSYLIFFASIFYGCYHDLIIQNININPESLCISGSTFIAFLFVLFLKKPTKIITFCLGIFPLILIMLKPIYLSTLITLGILIIVKSFDSNGKRILFWGIIGCLCSTIGIFVYCLTNKINNGEFVLSKISMNNSLANVISSGAYKFGKDHYFISIIDSTKDNNGKFGNYPSVFILNNEWIDALKIRYNRFPKSLSTNDEIQFCLNFPNSYNYSPKRINQFIENSKHTAIYIKYMFIRMLRLFSNNITLFIILFIDVIILLYRYIKSQVIEYSIIFFVFFVLSQLATISLIVGQFTTITYGDVDDINRLLLPCYPFLILITIQICSNIISILEKNDTI